MVVDKETNDLVNAYCILRDRQYAAYSRYAKLHKLTTNELFVLDLLWFSDGCTQTYICERLSANKQTVAAIVGRFQSSGLVVTEKISEDRRNKRILLTKRGWEFARNIIPRAADAENLAFAELGAESIKELVRLTTKFTENMENKFDELKETI